MPVIGPASWSGKIFARAFTSEGMLGVAGCAMAFASGSFALYTNMHGPASHEPSPYFTVFAQLSPRAHAVPVAAAAVLAPVVGIADDIDPVVTGSIPQRAPSAPVPSTASSATSHDSRPILANMLLRQIDGDNALVEINDSLVVYKIGDVIPGAGRLKAMTRQGGRPALETSRGLIVESR
ncbi:hypothetical protein [Beijerinckia sp. L45]|uniref:hypothetical protein n=1 Tax=Beijerinckia sp. L45 TaxID=1641855 RepID=UPI00131C8D9E|nr:hypothetical protein [Beijerinckia sp. L45]